MKSYLLACLACLVLLHAVPGQCQEIISLPDDVVDDIAEARDEEIIHIDDDEEIDIGRMLTALLGSSDDEQDDDDDDEDDADNTREGREANLSKEIHDPVMTEKYNKFVDAVLSRMSMIMRLQNDPMRIAIRKSGKVALESTGRNKDRTNRNKDRNKDKIKNEKRNKNRNKTKKNKNQNKGRKNSKRRGNRGTTARRRHPKDLLLDDVGLEDENEETGDRATGDKNLYAVSGDRNGQDDADGGVENENEETGDRATGDRSLDEVTGDRVTGERRLDEVTGDRVTGDRSLDEVTGDRKSQEDAEVMADPRKNPGMEDDEEELDEEEELDTAEENEVAKREKRAIATEAEDDDEYYDYELEDDEDDYALDGRDLDYAEDTELVYDDEYDDADYNEVESSDPLRGGRELEEQETSDIKMEENTEPDVTGRNRRRRRKQAAARRRRRRKGGRRKGKCGKACRRRRKAMRRRIRRRNKSKRRRGNRGKRSVGNGGRRPTAVLSGISRVRRNGDVSITERKDSQNIAANLEFGPILLKAEKIFGGPTQEVRRAEALATNVKGEIVINVNQDGTASVRKLRIIKPNSIQVSGNLRRKPSKSSNNFMQAYISKSRSLIVSKLKAVAAQILGATNISESQVEKMKRSVA